MNMNMNMNERAIDFFLYFDEIIDINNVMPRDISPKLRKYDIEGEIIGLTEIQDIVNGLRTGDIEIVKRWRKMISILVEYFHKTLNLIYNNRRDQDPDHILLNYGEHDPYGYNIWKLEESMEYLIQKMLNEIEPLGRTFEYLGKFDFAMKPEEDMALTSLGRQGIQTHDGRRLFLPDDVIRKIKDDFTGIKPRSPRRTITRKHKGGKRHTRGQRDKTRGR